MARCVGGDSRKVAKPVPQSSDSNDIDQVCALSKRVRIQRS